MKHPRLYIFVPENDLALASGTSHYTPPPIGMKMHLAGEALPMAYASEEDRFLTYGFSGSELKRLSLLMGRRIIPASREEIRSGRFIPAPWGWSAYTKSLLADMGIPLSTLPTTEAIEKMRMLSHRRTAIAVNASMGCEGASELFSAEEVDAMLSNGGNYYLKQPWSGSGRGVIATADLSDEAVRKFALASIRRQGSVFAEKALDSVGDFATLWFCTDGKAYFHGYSRFLTHGSGGKYAGNLVASGDTILRNILQLGITESHIEEAKVLLGEALTRHVAATYSGPVGVDMLAYTCSEGTVSIAPCIEINLRYTMGFVAQGLASSISLSRPMMLRVIPWKDINSLPTESIILSQPGALAYILEPVELDGREKVSNFAED